MNEPFSAPEPFRIEKVRRETKDTFSWELVPVMNTPYEFKPGQFNMLYLFGAGEVPISISGDPAKPGRIVHTTRSVGRVTNGMQGLKQDHVIGLRGPFGSGWPIELADGNDVVLIAGGIGLAPLRPAVYSLLSRRSKYGRIVILYGTRTPQDILFKKELEQWRSRFDLEVFVTVDHATNGWRGNVGVVTPILRRARFDPGNTVAMTCGPEVMMRFAAIELMNRGVDPQTIFVSMERNMKCAVGFCGHCQIGPFFVCKDGPIFSYEKIQPWISRGEV